MLRKLYVWSSAKWKTLLRSQETVEPLEFPHKQIPYSEPVPTPQSPYPPSVLSEALTRWKQGDRLALSDIHVEDLHNHSDRAHLALALGSAHQQVGNGDTARNFIQSARDWGLDKKTVAEVLVTDTYKTLGRAAAVARAGRNNAHVALAQAVGNGGLGQSNESTTKSSGSDAATYSLENEAIYDITERLNQVLTAVESQSKKINVLSADLTQKMSSASAQVDALMRIQTYLDSGILLPSFHGWPVSPDLACLLIQKIEQKRYNAVIEFGSGTSTVLIACVLDRLKDESGLTYQIAFEHLEKYYGNTGNSLAASRIKRHQPNLVLAPLVNMMEHQESGKPYKFYDCCEQLATLGQHHTVSHGKLLVIVDGPPGATGPHARFPGLPVVLAAFPYAEIDFLLDDTKRQDEKEILIMWRAILDQAKRPYQLTAYNFEKGATILEVQAC